LHPVKFIYMFEGKNKDRIEGLVNLILEARILKYITRGSYHYLKGPIKENVAEHSFYTVFFAWVLAKKEKANIDKVIKMAIIHDLIEARSGEHNLINRYYSSPSNDLKIIEEISEDHDIKDFDFKNLFNEYFKGETKEAKVTKDADILANMLVEKECLELGNKKAEKWIEFTLKRLKTDTAKKLGQKLKEIDTDKWWVELNKTKFL
jgi:putative hydrolase of HD superfamily